ncbi:NlpC/P60 family protein [uncultured Tateyamaria sp.]|uniref:NlpC/P60 family protein n=1 Tax=Tateyamaria sp. 1078 TaxID=3417464 RepID=UPI002607B13F|nr:NlpC/P60 family protein [uncultured Tateyamaria sp.]
MWTNDWIGLPYEALGRGPDSYDCLGLFLALQRARFGRMLDDPLCTMSAAVRKRLVEGAKPNWRKVSVVKEGDAALFNVRGLSMHVGFVVDSNRMLHASADVSESVLEDFRVSAWGARLEGVYRYAP